MNKAWAFMPSLAVLVLAGCSSPPPPQNFPPLDYSYLPPIVFKVSAVNVVNAYVPSPDEATLIGEDPEAPADALLAMLNHRIVASGTPGTATVTIETASIDEAGGNLSGAMVVDLHLVSGNGLSSGDTEVSVTASQTAPDSDASSDDLRAALYGLTKKLMNNMNVELQYEVQRHLGPWLSWAAAPGAAPLAAGAAGTGAAIQATPLSAPPSTTTTTTTTTTGTEPASGPSGNINPAVPQYLPGAGPAALTPAQ